MKLARDPRTPGEWREAVNAAKFFLAVHDCELYGLLTGPEVDVERCEQILAEGKAIGYFPEPLTELIKQFLVAA